MGSITVFLDQTKTNANSVAVYGQQITFMGVKFKGQSLTGLDNKITNKTVRCYGK